MVWQQSSRHFATLTLALTVELLTLTPLSTPAQSQGTSSSQNSWEVGETSAYDPPPNIGSPTRKESGATRNPETCSRREVRPNPPLTALIPKNTDLGVTVAERPTFFAYIPQTSAQTAKFVLQDEDDKQVYSTTFSITKVPGVVSFQLPDTAPKLQSGKTYQWTMAIVCPPKIDGSREEPGVYGKIWVTKLRSPIANELEKATPRDRFQLYRQYKIWHDALTTLAELRRANPNDAQLTAEWKQLLASAELSEFAEIPVFGQ
ncbi:DUF928 domain-containing protein [Planktothrix sp. FACHB-1355]|uniref:DUF928 domain-containing protein n=1 Tax=Aerosakkonema funiforme FACHB-1375 TaxID=2949571 RepID=A0A926ZIL8_9CYAN|nr:MULTISPECIES: DUF928 domain-containing protein [Oscillatoriales]MBD2183427.1 DUF928 domain-containing protein [Aerosakkonema funiforme FACHB-1375]MBD3557628.1 DUF928 domain-containing protein [Planktothrix sp. FACHB-1355]